MHFHTTDRLAPVPSASPGVPIGLSRRAERSERPLADTARACHSECTEWLRVRRSPAAAMNCQC